MSGFSVILAKPPEQELVDVRRLAGAAYNPRSMPDPEMRNLMGSLLEFGFVQPVVARREDRLIIGGHQRVEAMKRLIAEGKAKQGTKVPVYWLEGVDDSRAKQLNLALNRIGGEWDYEKLAAMLGELEDTALTGFSQDEVEDILALTSDDAGGAGSGDGPDIDAELAAERRKFAFVFASDAEAEECRVALQAFGMTGPGNAAQALLAALRQASQRKKRSQV